MARLAHTANGQLSESITSSADGDPAVQDESPRDAHEPRSAEESDDLKADKPPNSGLKLALTFGITAMLVMSAVAGWLGYRAYQQHRITQQRELFVQVARQAAINLTSISYTEVEADVQRILNSSTGNLYDDFLKRSQPFIEVVKKAQSTTAGTVTSAGLESMDGEGAQVLVTAQVKSSSVGAAEQAPRAWRMRMDVKRVGDEAKVSNVVFVP